ncbi:uncharacterized protein [Eurosta solidaginis]|uniref:uncharacterized protein isoform X1 n=1 Tax=Eurosta solidaginis TaxID=178769 RepID=UPI0035309851
MDSFRAQKSAFTGATNSPFGIGDTKLTQMSGGRFDFEDGGTYCGGWDDGKAHGHGVCTGPKHQGAFSGAWNYGFEVSGAYIWPRCGGFAESWRRWFGRRSGRTGCGCRCNRLGGSHYVGQWQNGRRHGLGVEQIGRQIYRGEWSKDGHKGRYGIRESTVSTARYEGTWNMGYQDGYGCETYADGGKYQGQWQEGKRHGYGIRTSAPFGLASHYRRKDMHSSLNSVRSSDANEAEKTRSEGIRGGFVLSSKSDKLSTRRNSLTEKSKKGFLSGFNMRKQKSTGDLDKRGTLGSSSVRSTTSTSSWVSTGSEQSNLTSRSTHTDSNASFTMEDEQLDAAVIETYMGEWKKDKRCGHGVAERSDGLRYEGEWYNNKKHGYGVTTLHDGSFEEGKYKNNVLITSQKKKHLFLARSRKLRDRINIAVNSAQRALKMAMQRSDIAISRTSTATDRAHSANIAATQAIIDCENAVKMAREFAPDFKPSVLERFKKLHFTDQSKPNNLLRSNNSTTFSGVPKNVQKHVPLQNELSKSNNNQNVKPDMEFQQANSTDYQKHNVTPQTDFVSLVSLQNQSSNIRFNRVSYSQTELNKELSTQHMEQQGMFDFNRNVGAEKSKSIGENHRSILSQTGDQNGSREKYEKKQSNNNSSILNGNSDQYDEYKYLVSKEDQKTNLHLQTMFNKQNLYQQTSTPENHNSIRRFSMQQNQNLLTSHYQTRQPIFNKMDQHLSIDYFDHYKRPPSRDSSIDRYARATSRLSESVGYNSRQPSIDRCFPKESKDLPSYNNVLLSREGSTSRASDKKSLTSILNPAITPDDKSPLIKNKPFEDIILCKRSLGQDIVPSPLTPKRTESLYERPTATPLKSTLENNYTGSKPCKNFLTNVSIQRKKSLPDIQDLPLATGAMSREEVSALGSARREAVRQQIQINERLRANPFLYLFSPQVKDWFSRQQLLLLVLFLNIILGLMFVKMLT